MTVVEAAHLASLCVVTGLVTRVVLQGRTIKRLNRELEEKKNEL